MNVPSLYTIASELAAVRAQMLDMGMDEETIADTIESLAIPFEQKAVGLTRINLEAEGFAKMAEEAAAALLERAKHIRHRIGKRQEYLINNMLAAGIERIDDPLTPITLRANPPAVGIIDEKQIPAQFWRTPEPRPPVAVPDKKAIAATLKTGLPVPGCELVKGYRLA